MKDVGTEVIQRRLCNQSASVGKMERSEMWRPTFYVQDIFRNICGRKCEPLHSKFTGI